MKDLHMSRGQFNFIADNFDVRQLPDSVVAKPSTLEMAAAIRGMLNCPSGEYRVIVDGEVQPGFLGL